MRNPSTSHKRHTNSPTPTDHTTPPRAPLPLPRPACTPTPAESKHRPTNNKQPLLLPPHPLHHPTSPLQQRPPGTIRARHAVELKLWRCPGERDGGLGDAVQDFGVCGAGVRGGVEGLVEGEEAAGVVSWCLLRG